MSAGGWVVWRRVGEQLQFLGAKDWVGELGEECRILDERQARRFAGMGDPEERVATWREALRLQDTVRSWQDPHRGPWVVRRHVPQGMGRWEYLGAEDAWVMFLADAVVVNFEPVARELVRMLRDEAPGDDSIEYVLRDEAQAGRLEPQPEDVREWLPDEGGEP